MKVQNSSEDEYDCDCFTCYQCRETIGSSTASSKPEKADPCLHAQPAPVIPFPTVAVVCEQTNKIMEGANPQARRQKKPPSGFQTVNVSNISGGRFNNSTVVFNGNFVFNGPGTYNINLRGLHNDETCNVALITAPAENQGNSGVPNPRVGQPLQEGPNTSGQQGHRQRSNHQSGNHGGGNTVGEQWSGSQYGYQGQGQSNHGHNGDGSHKQQNQNQGFGLP